MIQAFKSGSALCSTTVLFSALALSACLQTTPASNSDVVSNNGLAPHGAPAGTCWDKVSTPAVVETVTEKVLVTPAQTNPDGSIATLPVYRKENRQHIVTPRVDNWFETPCPPAFTVELVSTLQRALLARGLYSGSVTGNMDDATRSAVLAIQSKNGLHSEVLSMATARELGIVAVPRNP